MNMVKAGRGEHLMIGKSGMKPNRKVNLPTSDIILRGAAEVLRGAEPSPVIRNDNKATLKKKSKAAPRRLAALN